MTTLKDQIARFQERRLRNIIKNVLLSNSDAIVDSFSSIVDKLNLDQITTLTKAICNVYRESELPQKVIDLLESYSGGRLHYSQEGEDILLTRILDVEYPGFFIDVGAHHPVRFSNTYGLYKRGWRGINIDPTPGSMESFQRLRPEDINLECAISLDETPIPFFIFTEGALNTFDVKLAKEYLDKGWVLKETLEIKPRPLSDILKNHLKLNKFVTLLTIDVEGLEMEVLSSNDWDVCRPKVIIIEALSIPLLALESFPPVSYLMAKGYVPTSRLVNSVILQRME